MAALRRTSTSPDTDDYSEQMLVCIQNCQDCHRACLQTFAWCLKRGGRYADPDLLRNLLDCADICLTSATFMIRASDLHVHTCAACAAVCQHCADACAALADEPRMRAVADTCQHCADSCRAMASHQNEPPARGPASAPAPAAAVSRGPRRTGAVLSRRKTEPS